MWKILMFFDMGFHPNRSWGFLFLYDWADAFVCTSVFVRNLWHLLETRVKDWNLTCFIDASFKSKRFKDFWGYGLSISHSVAFEWQTGRNLKDFLVWFGVLSKWHINVYVLGLCFTFFRLYVDFLYFVSWKNSCFLTWVWSKRLLGFSTYGRSCYFCWEKNWNFLNRTLQCIRVLLVFYFINDIVGFSFSCGVPFLFLFFKMGCVFQVLYQPPYICFMG